MGPSALRSLRSCTSGERGAEPWGLPAKPCLSTPRPSGSYVRARRHARWLRTGSCQGRAPPRRCTDALLLITSIYTPPAAPRQLVGCPTPPVLPGRARRSLVLRRQALQTRRIPAPLPARRLSNISNSFRHFDTDRTGAPAGPCCMVRCVFRCARPAQPGKPAVCALPLAPRARTPRSRCRRGAGGMPGRLRVQAHAPFMLKI